VDRWSSRERSVANERSWPTSGIGAEPDGVVSRPFALLDRVDPLLTFDDVHERAPPEKLACHFDALPVTVGQRSLLEGCPSRMAAPGRDFQFDAPAEGSRPSAAPLQATSGRPNFQPIGSPG